MPKMQVDLYTQAKCQSKQLMRVFFARVRIMRNDRGLSKLQLVNNMQVLRAKISIHTLTSYEANRLDWVQLNLLLIFCEYFEKSFEEMIKPLTSDEATKINALEAKGQKSAQSMNKKRA